MMSLPPELEQCLHKHTPYILKHMRPDGVYIFMSGAKLLDDEDHALYNRAPDVFDKNHALLKIVAKHGRKGFESFLEALETTRQDYLAQKIKATLNWKYSNEPKIKNIDKIKNDSGISSSHPTISHPTTSAFVMGGPRPAGSLLSPTPSRSRSLTRTPLTPPLSEDELDEHLLRLKTLLNKISTTHNDRFCRQEAKELLGELDEAGESMMQKVRELSEENLDKERELRQAKYMVRGMETEINRLRTSASAGDSTDTALTTRASNGESSTAHIRDAGKVRRENKSKLCTIL